MVKEEIKLKVNDNDRYVIQALLSTNISQPTSEISRKLGIERKKVYGSLKKLEKNGYAKRTYKSGNSINWKITNKGLKEFSKLKVEKLEKKNPRTKKEQVVYDLLAKKKANIESMEESEIDEIIDYVLNYSRKDLERMQKEAEEEKKELQKTPYDEMTMLDVVKRMSVGDRWLRILEAQNVQYDYKRIKQEEREQKFNDFIKEHNIEPDNYGMDYVAIYDAVDDVVKEKLKEQDKDPEKSWNITSRLSSEISDMDDYMPIIHFKSDIQDRIDSGELKGVARSKVPTHPRSKSYRRYALEISDNIAKILEEDHDIKLNKEDKNKIKDGIRRFI